MWYTCRCWQIFDKLCTINGHTSVNFADSKVATSLMIHVIKSYKNSYIMHSVTLCITTLHFALLHYMLHYYITCCITTLHVALLHYMPHYYITLCITTLHYSLLLYMTHHYTLHIMLYHHLTYHS